jgi:Leucine-rich repeat (LRR) protein
MLNNGADAFLSMQGLKRFRCSHNLLTSGTVPWTTLSLLPKLSHLLLDNNRLESVNPVICQATSLRVLNVSANLLPDLPSDMHLLQELEELDVSDNKIRALPCELGATQMLLSATLLHQRGANFARARMSRFFFSRLSSLRVSCGSLCRAVCAFDMDSGQHEQDRGHTCHVATAAVSQRARYG